MVSIGGKGGRKLQVCGHEYFGIPANSRTLQEFNLNFQDFLGSKSFSRSFQEWKFYKNIQDFPGGLGTLWITNPPQIHKTLKAVQQIHKKSNKWRFSLIEYSRCRVLRASITAYDWNMTYAVHSSSVSSFVHSHHQAAQLPETVHSDPCVFQLHSTHSQQVLTHVKN